MSSSPKGNYQVIADSRREPFSIAAAQSARLRGMVEERCDLSEGFKLPQNCALLALSASTFQQMSPAHRTALADAVAAGAVLYLRGPARPGETIDLRPLHDHPFHVAVHQQASGYNFTAHPVVPHVLEDEVVKADLYMPGAEDCDGWEPLVLAQHTDGRARPSILMSSHGAGTVICDLQAELSLEESLTPLAQRLAHPLQRVANMGALIAAQCAAHADPKRKVAFNLTLDDRPVNFDFFCAEQLQAWLAHMEQIYPGNHVDFGWTPDQAYPSKKYVDVLKHFNTGFAWHGFHRHVDHREIGDLSAELAAGERLVRDICNRFSIRFQRVMIFPFEYLNIEAVRRLKQAGFLASVEMSHTGAEVEERLPGFMRYSTALHSLYRGFFPVLRRWEGPQLTRDQMLAQAALEMPIIGAGHPRNVTLKRFARFVGGSGSIDYFDPILNFAAEKQLRPCSLEQIACEVLN